MVEWVSLGICQVFDKSSRSGGVKTFSEHRNYFSPVWVKPAMLLDSSQPLRLRQAGQVAGD
jgi:hypothetical protein